MTLPLVRLRGTSYDQGVQHGRTLRERILHNLEVYFYRFKYEARLEREAVLAHASTYRAAIERRSPAYAAGMQGIAEGAGVSLDEVAALNVRYELLYYQFGQIALKDAGLPKVDGCTSFAVLPEASANGHLLLGQNWDWIPEVQGALLHAVDPDGFQVLSFTEAGIFGGKIGLNSAGVGLAINGVTTTDDDWTRLSTPFHARSHAVLRSRRFEEAVEAVTGEERACSTNFLVGQAPDRVVNLEAAPSKVGVQTCRGGCVVHSNHFVDPAGLGIVEPPMEKRPHSYLRSQRLTSLLAEQQITVEALQDYLRDHDDYPYGLCRHEDPLEPPEEQYLTVASIIMDLHDGVMHVTDGPPCRSAYQTVELDRT